MTLVFRIIGYGSSAMNRLSASSKTGGRRGGFGEPWVIRLYIAGWTPASLVAVRNIKLLESEYFPPGSTVEIIDIVENPEAGRRDHVLAIPTVVRIKPLPVRRVVGTLGDLDKALKVLGFT